jgi:hypothetical protein
MNKKTISMAIKLGAIRWDAWYADTGPATSTKSALSNPLYQDRAPFFAERTGPKSIRFNSTPATMSREIAFAASANLYWAFLRNDPNGALAEMEYGWNLFQASPDKNSIKWCDLRPTALFGSTGNYASRVAEILSLMQQPNYLTVLTNRPVIYIYWDSSAMSTFGGSTVNFKAALDALRTACTGAGLGTPYIVVVKDSGEAQRSALGADAVSSYIGRVPDGLDKTYAALDTSVQGYWAEQLALAANYVPIGMCGWNRRPRIERPTTWEATTQRPYFGNRYNHANPTNAELAAHIAAEKAYIAANPAKCPAELGLIYAWNEHDEGGWLCPTIDDQAGTRLAAVAAVT